MPDIYEYIDYRKFIQDYYKEQKVLDSKFSYQIFANKAGLKTKTFIHKVISYQKMLASRSTVLISQAMNLSKAEKYYFEALVNFNNASDTYQQDNYFKSLLKYNQKKEFVKKYKNIYDFYSNWYYSILYNLVTSFDWLENYTFLGNLIEPVRIPSHQVKKAVTCMLELGLIVKKADKYEKTAQSILVDDPIKRYAIRKYQSQIIGLGIQAAQKNKGNLIILNGKISEEFKNSIYTQLFRINDPEEKIYQACILMFPVSKI